MHQTGLIIGRFPPPPVDSPEKFRLLERLFHSKECRGMPEFARIHRPSAFERPCRGIAYFSSVITVKRVRIAFRSAAQQYRTIRQQGRGMARPCLVHRSGGGKCCGLWIEQFCRLRCYATNLGFPPQPASRIANRVPGTLSLSHRTPN